MTIHLAKLHLATNGKQSSYGVNEVKSLFCLVRSVQMKKNWEWQKQMESDLNGLLMNRHSGGKKHSIFTFHTSFFFPDGDLSVCRACHTCVFSYKRTKACMSMVRYSRGEIFSLFAMCDYINPNFI